MNEVIDSHQHFWQYNAMKHSWIDDEMAVIRKNFLPADLQKVYEQNKVDGCVTVQADQTDDETMFLLQLAADNAFIKGVVGWVDLRAENITQQLQGYKDHKVLKGFRHVLQGEDPSFMLQSSFIRGIKALQAFGYTYDILVFPQHLKAVQEFIPQFPGQSFVIDHLAKPYIKAGKINEWKKDMLSMAQFENVYCKISGMVTEADYKNWKISDFSPYMDAVLAAFGTKRLMFGSDWPVCLVAATYDQMKAIVDDYFAPFSTDEKAAIFGKTATTFYRL